MHILAKTRGEIADRVNQALGNNIIQALDLVCPPNPKFGDLSLPCFALSKKIKKTPVEAASLLLGKMKANKILSAVNATGPYLNFVLNKNYLIRNVIKEVEDKKANYGAN